jgi:hypothetical protein
MKVRLKHNKILFNKLIEMDSSDKQTEFMKKLINMVKQISEYKTTPQIQRFLQVSTRINKKKIIKYFVDTSSKYLTAIHSKDESIFKEPVYFLPDIDLSHVWTYLEENQKEKVWLYLQILTVSGIMMEQNVDIQTDEPVEQTESKEFNPYIGIQTNPDVSLSVDDMQANSLVTLKNKDEKKSTGSPSFLNGLNLGSLLNGSLNGSGIDGYLKELQSQLLNSDQNDIDSAMNKMKSMINQCNDPSTVDFMTDIMDNLTSELKNKNLAEGNIIENFQSLAQKVSEKIQTKNGSNTNILKHLKNMMTTMTAPKPGEESEDGFPSHLMDKLFNVIENMNDPNLDSQKEMMDCMSECQNMMKSFGFDMSKMGDILQSLNKP